MDAAERFAALRGCDGGVACGERADMLRVVIGGGVELVFSVCIFISSLCFTNNIMKKYKQASQR